MAVLVTSATDPIRFDSFDLFTGNATTRTSQLLVLDTGDGYTERFTGTGLTYGTTTHTLFTGGVITGWEERYDGAIAFKITGLNVNVADYARWADGDNPPSAFDRFFGSDDSMTGSPFDDAIDSYGGHDVLIGGAGADRLDGGAGNDHIYGGGTTVIDGDLNDYIFGGNGNDYVNGNAGDDTIFGDNANVFSQQDGSDRLNGGKGNDTIYAEGGNDTINGNQGNDTIYAAGGNDLVQGGQGNDSVMGGKGNDTVIGNKGVDDISGGDGSRDFVADVFLFNYGDALYETSGAAAYRTDRVMDFEYGGDHIRLPFGLPGSLTTVGPFNSVALAEAAAMPLLQADSSSTDVVQAVVGTNVYLFFSSNTPGTLEAIEGSGGALHLFTLDDFI